MTKQLLNPNEPVGLLIPALRGLSQTTETVQENPEFPAGMVRDGEHELMVLRCRVEVETQGNGNI